MTPSAFWHFLPSWLQTLDHWRRPEVLGGSGPGSPGGVELELLARWWAG